MYALVYQQDSETIHVKPTGKWIYFSQQDLLGIQVTWTTPGILWFKDKTHIKYVDDSKLDIVYENTSEVPDDYNKNR